MLISEPEALGWIPLGGLLIGVRLVEAAGQITLILESAMIFIRWETRAIMSNVDEMMV